jgi:serine/threonine protein kinase
MKKSLGNYHILEEIGSGGMAVIYKANQKSLGRLVAIKQLQSGFVTDSEVVKRFEREARAAAELQHENIVLIHDYWEKSGSYYIVMEYVDGTDLSRMIQRVGTLPVDIVLVIVLQIAKALEYAHGKGVVHRDIKPGNIMISREGKVKLMDFGIARVRSSKGDELTRAGVLLGTPAYMSPEQILGGKVNWQTDLFSLGIVLYEMLTGDRPFKPDAKFSVTEKIMQGEFVPPRKLNRKIPRSLQKLILRCLNPKPGKRYRDTSRLRRRLEELAEKKAKKAEYQERLRNYLIKCGIFKGAVAERTVVKKAKPKAKPKLNWPRIFWATKITLLTLIPAFLFSHFQNPGILIHRLSKGETLAALAEQYYGDYRKSIYLINRNRISHPARLRPGRDIAVPLITHHQIGIGDSLAKLAGRYLGDTRKAKFIAQFNATGEDSPLKLGDRIRIPFELRHKVRRGQTLASIAKLYYGNTIGYQLIMSYNFITDVQSLKVGDVLKVPVTTSKIKRRGWIQRALDTIMRPPEEEYSRELEEAIELYQEEDYPGSLKKLRSLLKVRELGVDDLVRIRKYLAFGYARLEEKEMAAEQFLALLELQPDFRLDEKEVPPVILDVFNNLEIKEEISNKE